MDQGLHRVAQVLLGCCVGILLVAWALAQVWPLPEPRAKGTGGKARDDG